MCWADSSWVLWLWLTMDHYNPPSHTHSWQRTPSNNNRFGLKFALPPVSYIAASAFQYWDIYRFDRFDGVMNSKQIQWKMELINSNDKEVIDRTYETYVRKKGLFLLWIVGPFREKIRWEINHSKVNEFCSWLASYEYSLTKNHHKSDKWRWQNVIQFWKYCIDIEIHLTKSSNLTVIPTIETNLVGICS